MQKNFGYFPLCSFVFLSQRGEHEFTHSHTSCDVVWNHSDKGNLSILCLASESAKEISIYVDIFLLQYHPDISKRTVDPLVQRFPDFLRVNFNYISNQTKLMFTNLCWLGENEKPRTLLKQLIFLPAQRFNPIGDLW